MDREVRWAESAFADLDEIAEYIAKDSDFYAATVVRELTDAARSLARFAERGRVVPEYQEPTIRELIVGNYRLVYEITDQPVTHVLRIIHAARLMPAHR